MTKPGLPVLHPASGGYTRPPGASPGVPVFPSISGYSRSHVNCLRGHGPGHEPRPASLRGPIGGGAIPPPKQNIRFYILEEK